ncbi:MAG: NAD(P)-dependent oxidoreductase [Acidobacteriota bacterium]
MAQPRLILTGASGFLGRHLLEYLKDEYEIFSIARRSPQECGVPEWPNLHWFQVDIGEASHLRSVFDAILSGGGVDLVIHLAAHYDFTGEDHPEYWRTNVGGLRNVLELCKPLRVRRFFYASSVAASRLPPPGGVLNEESPPDGEHVYAITKRIGEEMLREYVDTIPSCIVRFGAMFSDWCEYPPLFKFLETWLSRSWNARVLGGRGISSIPYFHVRDAVAFFKAALSRRDLLSPCEILIASTSGSTNHRELFDAATRAYFSRPVRPIYMPKILCGPGMLARDLVGRTLGDRPFERPWMARYIDLQMNTDASRTYARLNWQPRERLHILRRMPFLVENLRTNPEKWNALNRAAMKEVRQRINLRIHRLLEAYEEAIVLSLMDAFRGPKAKPWFLSYKRISPEELEWAHRQVLRQVMNVVRTREKAIFINYCRDLAYRRFSQGFSVHELADALQTVNDVVLKVILQDPKAQGMEQALQDHITMTINLGIDQIQDVYEELSGASYTPPV